MWRLTIMDQKSNVKCETTVETDKDLGAFLLGYNKKRYRVIEMKEIPFYKIKESKEFLKKKKNLEFGG